MILRCSRGHELDLGRFETRFWHGNLKSGDRCPMEMSYNRMDGSTYCRRILRPVPDEEKKDEQPS